MLRSQGSFGVFGHIPAPKNSSERRRRTHEGTWTKLEEAIPKTEEKWQVARRRHHFHSAELMIRTLSRPLDPSEKDTLYAAVFQASRLVESYLAGNKSK